MHSFDLNSNSVLTLDLNFGPDVKQFALFCIFSILSQTSRKEDPEVWSEKMDYKFSAAGRLVKTFHRSHGGRTQKVTLVMANPDLRVIFNFYRKNPSAPRLREAKLSLRPIILLRLKPTKTTQDQWIIRVRRDLYNTQNFPRPRKEKGSKRKWHTPSMWPPQPQSTSASPPVSPPHTEVHEAPPLEEKVSLFHLDLSTVIYPAPQPRRPMLMDRVWPRQVTV